MSPVEVLKAQIVFIQNFIPFQLQQWHLCHNECWTQPSEYKIMEIIIASNNTQIQKISKNWKKKLSKEQLK